MAALPAPVVPPEWNVNQLLPYEIDRQAEQVERWEEIKRQLHHQLRQRNYAPGAFYWTKQLHSHLELKHRIPLEDRKALVQLFVELAVTPGMDLSLVSLWSQTAVRLLESLHLFVPNDFTFNWKPFYAVLKDSFFSPSRKRALSSDGQNISQVVKLMRYVRRYFPATETTEQVLQEFLPMLYPQRMTAFISAVTLLSEFLPVHLNGASSDAHPQSQWASFFFEVWSGVVGSKTADLCFMDLFSRVAEQQYGHSTFRFTDDQIRFIFNLGLKWMELPVGSGLSRNDAGGISFGGKQTLSSGVTANRRAEEAAGVNLCTRRKGDRIGMLAAFIIFTIYPTNNETTGSLAYLDHLVKAIEDFYHPSNSGRWSTSLVNFLHMLLVALHDRVDREKYWRDAKANPNLHKIYPEQPYSEEYHLTPSITRRIIEIVRPALFMALFAKDQRAMLTVCAALNHIAWMEPDMVLPGILEKVYQSLESHSEAHRLISCLASLGSSCLPFLHRRNNPSGVTHLLSMMELALPALDMNDPVKASVALIFYLKIFVSVPMMEVTPGGSLPSYETLARPAEDQYEDDSYDIPPRDASSLQQYDEFARDCSHSWETFIQAYMTKMLALLENIPALGEDSGHENTIAYLIPFTVEVLLSQLSPDLFSVALSKVVQAARMSHLSNARVTIGQMIGGAMSADPERTANALIPIFVDHIFSELEHGAGANPTTSKEHYSVAAESSDHSSGQFAEKLLIWYLSHLVDVLRNCRASVALKWKKEVYSVVDAVWSKCLAYEPVKLASKVVRAFIFSLSGLTLTECRSAGPADWNNEEWRKEHWKWWGITLMEGGFWQTRGAKTVKEIVDPQWQIPNEEEKNAALDALCRYMDPELKQMQELLLRTRNDASFRSGMESTSDFVKCLTMILNLEKSMVMLAGDYLSSEQDEDAEMEDLPGEEGGDGYGDEEGMDEDEEYVQEDVDTMEVDAVDSASIEEKMTGGFPKKRPIQVGYCFKDETDPRYQQIVDIRRRIGDLMHELVAVLREFREDDTESGVIVIKMMKTFLCNRGIERTAYDEIASSYQTIKTWMKSDRERECRRYPRYVLIHRVLKQQCARMKHNSLNIPLHSTLTSSGTVKLLVNDLLQLSLSTYAEIRVFAQSVLTQTLRCYPSAKYRILPQLFDILDASFDQVAELENAEQKNDTAIMDVHNTIKGGLYLLLSKLLLYICLRDWKYFSRFVLCLGRAQLVDKPTIQALARKLFLECTIHFTESSFSTPWTASLEAKIMELGNFVQDPVAVSGDFLQKLQRRADNRRKAYDAVFSKLLEQMSTTESRHWRIQMISAHFLSMITREDIPVRKDVLAHFLRACTSELLPMRQASLGSMNRLMYNIKKRGVNASGENAKGAYKKTVEFYDVPLKKHFEKIAIRDITEAEWNQSEFIDSSYAGWWCWPQSMKVYRPGNEHTRMVFCADPGSKEAFDLLQETFQSGEFWKKHLQYASQETTPLMMNAMQRMGEGAPEEHFSFMMSRFYKAVFQFFEDDFLYEHITPTLETWLKSEEKSQIRASAELCAGIVRGMKHWPWAKQDRLWKWLIPPLKHAMMEATPEILGVWGNFLYFVTANRDPRRIMPILQMIFRDKEFAFNAKSDSSFSEAKKIDFRQEMIQRMTWHLFGESDTLLESTCKHLNYTYKQGRELLAANFWQAATAMRFLPSFKLEQMYGCGANVKAFLAELAKGHVHFPVEVDEKVTGMMHSSLRQIRQWKTDLVKAEAEAGGKQVFLSGTDYSNGCKTVIRWINECMGRTNGYLIVPFLVESVDGVSVFSDLVAMTGTDDQDLDIMAISALSFIPECQFPLATTITTVKQVIQTIEADLVSTSADQLGLDEDKKRRKKLLGLAYLQVFFFRHLPFAFDGQVLSDLIQFVSRLLQDRLVEVRQMAAITLSGLVRCSNDESVVERLLQQFQDAAKTPLTPDTLTQRHAGVLGMSAIVGAYPYDIPLWLPDTLVSIGKHANDGSPINLTVKHTFAEFRRTHQETWYEDVLRSARVADYHDLYDFTPAEKGSQRKRVKNGGKGIFTSDHLDALEGLLTSSVNYYV